MSNKKSGFRNSGKGTVPVDTIVKVVLRLLLAFVLMGGLIGMSMYLIHRDIGNKTDVEERYDSGVSNNIKGKDVADDIDSGLYIANIKCNYFVPGEEIIVSVNNGETWTKYNHYEHDKELDIKIESGQTIIIGYKKKICLMRKFV